MILEKKEGKSYRRTVKEEHYVLVRKPVSTYMDHVIPQFGLATIKLSLVKYLEDNNINTIELIVVGCDGTTQHFI